MTENLGRIPVRKKMGSEPFTDVECDLGFDLLDFWQWSASDLVANTARGVLAEYLVARALGIDVSGVHDGWTAYDLCTRRESKLRSSPPPICRVGIRPNPLSSRSVHPRRELGIQTRTSLMPKQSARLTFTSSPSSHTGRRRISTHLTSASGNSMCCRLRSSTREREASNPLPFQRSRAFLVVPLLTETCRRRCRALSLGSSDRGRPTRRCSRRRFAPQLLLSVRRKRET